MSDSPTIQHCVLKYRAFGITDTRKVFHSFGHLFKDMCREAGITEEVHARCETD